MKKLNSIFNSLFLSFNSPIVMFNIEIIPSVFEGRFKPGDFAFMIRQMIRNNEMECLFIFNDNEECHFTDFEGGGNAAIRKYNRHSSLNFPYSAGIPTGSLDFGGYEELDKHTKFIIDQSFKEIKKMIEIFKYKRIYFSVGKDGKLGSSIFDIAEEVKDYITEQIWSLSNHKETACIPAQISHPTNQNQTPNYTTDNNDVIIATNQIINETENPTNCDIPCSIYYG